jgi:hypothetical protein
MTCGILQTFCRVGIRVKCGWSKELTSQSPNLSSIALETIQLSQIHCNKHKQYFRIIYVMMSTSSLPVGKGWPVHRHNNLIAICEALVYKTLKSRRLTTS